MQLTAVQYMHVHCTHMQLTQQYSTCMCIATHLLVAHGGEGEGEGRSDSGKALHNVGVVPECGVGARDGGGEERGRGEGHDRSRLKAVQLSWWWGRERGI